MTEKEFVMTLDPSIKETLEKTYNYLSEYFAKNVDIGHP